MKVTAKLFATLRDHAPPEANGSTFVQSAAEGATVGDLLDLWAIPENVVLILFVNSVHAERDRVLHDGDVLAVFPPIAGG